MQSAETLILNMCSITFFADSSLQYTHKDHEIALFLFHLFFFPIFISRCWKILCTPEQQDKFVLILEGGQRMWNSAPLWYNVPWNTNKVREIWYSVCKWQIYHKTIKITKMFSVLWFWQLQFAFRYPRWNVLAKGVHMHILKKSLLNRH